MSPQRVLILVVSVLVIVICLAYVVKRVKYISSGGREGTEYEDVQMQGNQMPWVPQELRDQMPQDLPVPPQNP